MKDARLAALAGAQYNRVARRQLEALGFTSRAIAHRVACGRLVVVEQAVFAMAPVLEHDPWGRWMGATLTERGTLLSHRSAAVARGWLDRESLITVVRPGDGGPRRHGGVLVRRSERLAAAAAEFRRVPITSVPRTLVDIAATESPATLGRCVREALRLEHTTVTDVAAYLRGERGRRGVRRAALALERYAGLPVSRTRSASEIRALEILRDAGFAIPRVNVSIAGIEADLSWASPRLIIEVDGGPFHRDRGADDRRDRTWTRAGWKVIRVPSQTAYEQPERLVQLADEANVPRRRV